MRGSRKARRRDRIGNTIQLAASDYEGDETFVNFYLFLSVRKRWAIRAYSSLAVNVFSSPPRGEKQ